MKNAETIAKKLVEAEGKETIITAISHNDGGDDEYRIPREISFKLKTITLFDYNDKDIQDCEINIDEVSDGSCSGLNLKNLQEITIGNITTKDIDEVVNCLYKEYKNRKKN